MRTWYTHNEEAGAIGYQIDYMIALALDELEKRNHKPDRSATLIFFAVTPYETDGKRYVAVTVFADV